MQKLAQLLASRFHAECRRAKRTDIWQARPLGTLEVAVHDPTLYRSAVSFVQQVEPDARLYDSDLMLASLYAWQKDVFPLARVEVDADEEGSILALACQDDPWALDYELPPLRIMEMRLAGLSHVNPAHGRRGALEIEIEGESYSSDDSDIPAAENFARLL